MKKSKLMKIFLVGILSLMLVLTATQVLADDDDGFTDLTGSISNTTNTTEAGTNNTLDNNTTNNTVNNTTNSTLNDLNTTNTPTNISSSYNNNTPTNMSSSYNNTNLPSTGLGDTTSIMFIIVVLAISAIYAYKKVSDYKNL